MSGAMIPFTAPQGMAWQLLAGITLAATGLMLSLSLFSTVLPRSQLGPKMSVTFGEVVGLARRWEMLDAAAFPTCGCTPLPWPTSSPDKPPSHCA